MGEVNPLNLPADMLMEMAMGVTPAIDVAQKHGYTLSDYMKMCTYPSFHRAIEQMKADLDGKGLTFQNKMGYMAELLLVDAFDAARKSESANVKLDVAKYLTKIANLEPQPGVAAAGGGFSITINLGNKSVTVQQNAAPEQIEDATVLSDDEILPPTTSSLLPPITINQDLSANYELDRV